MYYNQGNNKIADKSVIIYLETFFSLYYYFDDKYYFIFNYIFINVPI